jgi:SAM-dependent methyltransferase
MTLPIRRKKRLVSGSHIQQRDCWNGVASRVHDLYPAASTKCYRQREIELIRNTIGPLQGKKVLKLDLWNEAWNTRILNWMASQGAEVYGLDISSVTTVRAFRNIQPLDGIMHITQADIRLIPFEDNSFDFVYTMGTIEHIVEYNQALREVFRVLKVGAKAIIGVPYNWDIFLRPVIVMVLDVFRLYPYGPEKAFSWREFHRGIEGSGLSVRRRTGILLMPGLLRMMDLFFLRRGLNLYPLMQLLLCPFEFAESHWMWTHYLGYLEVAEAEKPSSLLCDQNLSG